LVTLYYRGIGRLLARGVGRWRTLERETDCKILLESSEHWLAGWLARQARRQATTVLDSQPAWNHRFELTTGSRLEHRQSQAITGACKQRPMHVPTAIDSTGTGEPHRHARGKCTAGQRRPHAAKRYADINTHTMRSARNGSCKTFSTKCHKQQTQRPTTHRQCLWSPTDHVMLNPARHKPPIAHSVSCTACHAQRVMHRTDYSPKTCLFWAVAGGVTGFGVTTQSAAMTMSKGCAAVCRT
jgi:hypothetical protein